MVVKIDYKKCLGAEACGNCLRICPVGVFMNVPIGKYKGDPWRTSYKIVPYFRDLCNNCRACQKVCPKNCIYIHNKLT